VQDVLRTLESFDGSRPQQSVSIGDHAYTHR
jgi:hypothetical protein